MAARFERNPGAWPRLAHSPEMRAYLDRLAEELAERVEATAPHDSGSYAASITGEVVEDDGYPTARVMAHDPRSLQIEYGTGRPATTRERPQGGRSPQFHPLLRSLLWLEARE